MNKLKLGMPKGSLQESTIELFKKAGIRVHASDRSYFPTSDDDELEIMPVSAYFIPSAPLNSRSLFPDSTATSLFSLIF